MKTYARPHCFGSDSSLEKGGSHRWYRQIDLTVFEARSAGPIRMDRAPTNLGGGYSGGFGFTSDGDSRGSKNEDQDVGMEPSRSLDEAIAAAQELLDKKQAAAAAGTTSASASLSSREDEVDGDGGDVESPRSSFHGIRPSGAVAGVGGENASQDGSGNSTSAQESKGNSSGNDDQYASGPIAGAGSSDANQGLSHSQTLPSQQQPSTTFSPATGQGFSSARRTSEPNTNTYFNAPVDSYCMVIASGHVAAKTKVRASSPISGAGGYAGGSGGGYSQSSGGSGSVVWVEKFSLPDLPDLSELRIDVLQSNRSSNASQPTSSGNATSSSSSNTNKFSLLGSVELPIETIRRGEEIDGWYPIWSYNPKSEEDGLSNLNHNAGCKVMIGELKMIVKVREETVLPLRKYTEIEKALNAQTCVDLIYQLSKHLDEDAIISHLVNVYTSSGTVVQRLADLAERESNLLGDQPESELLFR